MLLRASSIVVTTVMLLAVVPAYKQGATAPNGGSDPRFINGAADLVLLDGKVITVVSDASVAEAVAIKGGRILEVGNNSTIQRLIGPTTHIFDLHGKAVLPGFIDAHTHIEGIADYHRMLDLHVPPLKDVDEMLQKIKERINQTRAGDWILGPAVGVNQCRPDNSLTWWLPIIL